LGEAVDRGGLAGGDGRGVEGGGRVDRGDPVKVGGYGAEVVRGLVGAGEPGVDLGGGNGAGGAAAEGAKGVNGVKKTKEELGAYGRALEGGVKMTCCDLGGRGGGGEEKGLKGVEGGTGLTEKVVGEGIPRGVRVRWWWGGGVTSVGG